ncbi:Cytochrome P450 protein [Rutstroemia sp. NJR-2017a BVV2]|nr:Cytochrome P450 protein [Rutstroemia sp. NJR-2017a BVV2]
MFIASINAAIGILWNCILWYLKAMDIKVALLYLWCIYLTYLLRVPKRKCTCGAKPPVLVQDLDLAEDILTSSSLCSRSGPNQRLVQAFDIDNAFTTLDFGTYHEFVSRTKDLLHRPDPSIASIIQPMRRSALEEALIIRLKKSVPVLPLVQVFCFRFVLLKFFASSCVDTSPTLSILRITQLINSLWIASKRSCSPNLPDFVIMKKELQRELGLLFSYSEDEKENPLNILLPTYETLWRVVFRCFLEVSFRNPSHITEWKGLFERFLENPTPRQFSERKGRSAVQDIVKESLRLYPPTRRIYRQEAEDSALFAIDVEYLQRMEEVWGADGKSFRPERWGILEAAGNASYKRAWMPFGKGSFDCPARKLAPMMIGVLVGILIQSFGGGEWILDGRKRSVLNEKPLENGRGAMEGLTIRKIETQDREHGDGQMD